MPCSPYNVLSHLLNRDLVYPEVWGEWGGELLPFDQEEYFALSSHTYSMDDTGYVFVPAACASGDTMCILHVFFHGCDLEAEQVRA